MGKTLIIPDIHLKHQLVQKIIDNHLDCDKVICLGDYFHDFDDTVEMNVETAKWIKQNIDNPKFVFLLGNHDIVTFFPYNKYVSCSGNSKAKFEAILQVLSQTDFPKFKLYYIEQDIFFSHAGLSRLWVNLYIKNNKFNPSLKNVQKNLDKIYVKECKKLASGQDSALFGCGGNRGGYQTVGGLTWCDLGEFRPLPFNQIAGHNPLKQPCFLYDENKELKHFGISDYKAEKMSNWNLYLDTHLKNYAILDDKHLNIYSVDNFSMIFNFNI